MNGKVIWLSLGLLFGAVTQGVLLIGASEARVPRSSL
jgi:hypothetical protein